MKTSVESGSFTKALALSRFMRSLDYDVSGKRDVNHTLQHSRFC